MGLLDNGGNGTGIDPQQLMQMIQMMRAQQQDPFARSMPGDGLLGGATPPSVNPGQGDPQNMQALQAMMANAAPRPNVQQSLPVLPPSFNGFGLGQFAPKEIQPPNGIKQQLIQHLLTMLQPQQNQQLMSPPGMAQASPVQGRI